MGLTRGNDLEAQIRRQGSGTVGVPDTSARNPNFRPSTTTWGTGNARPKPYWDTGRTDWRTRNDQIRAADTYSRLQRSELLRRQSQSRAMSVGAQTGNEYNQQLAGLNQYFGMFMRRGSGAGTLDDKAVVALPTWVTQDMIDQIRSSGMYGGQPIRGMSGEYGEGFGQSNFVWEEGDGTQYLGVNNSWEDGYFAVGQTAGGYAIREAIYTPNSVVAELSKMTNEQLTDFRAKAGLVNLHAEKVRGKGLTSESFGLAREQGAADNDVMAYIMGFANENAMTWGAALNAITSQATGDFNSGLFDVDGTGTGTSGEKPAITKETTTTYNLSDVNFARQTLVRFMEAKTGRMPRANEVAEFLGVMNAAEKKNPDVSVTEWDVDDYNRAINPTTTSTPGNVDYDEMALSAVDTQESRDFQTDMAFDVIKKLAGW